MTMKLQKLDIRVKTSFLQCTVRQRFIAIWCVRKFSS